LFFRGRKSCQKKVPRDLGTQERKKNPYLKPSADNSGSLNRRKGEIRQGNKGVHKKGRKGVNEKKLQEYKKGIGYPIRKGNSQRKKEGYQDTKVGKVIKKRGERVGERVPHELEVLFQAREGIRVGKTAEKVEALEGGFPKKKGP